MSAGRAFHNTIRVFAERFSSIVVDPKAEPGWSEGCDVRRAWRSGKWWCLERSLPHLLVAWAVPYLGLLAIAGAALSLSPGSWNPAWILGVAIYFLFYCRLAQIAYWSWDTFSHLRHHLPGTAHWQSTMLGGGTVPTFHILIAAYDAPSTIGPVLRAIQAQDYPREHLTTWVITDELEEERKRDAADRLATLAVGVTPRPPDEARAARPLLWTMAIQDCPDLESLAAALLAGRFAAFTRDPRARDGITDTFCFLALVSERDIATLLGECQDQLLLCPDEADAFRAEVLELSRTVDRTMSGFAQLLGSEAVYTRHDIVAQLLSSRPRHRRLRRLAARAWNRLPADAAPPPPTAAEASFRSLARAITPSTQDSVRQMLPLCPPGSVRHLDRRGRGAKPGALNAAYAQIRAEGLLAGRDHVHLLVIDSDSLLPSHALATIAGVIMDGRENPGIVQLASLPTANFFCGNWYSHFVAFSDAIGALGKWSRSTRRRLKPDLNAGSGVVVPAVLAEYIHEQCGAPWDESSLTEDARLIVGQFGLTNGARNTTRMAPVYLLEAVPFAPSFRDTFTAFWNQRRRWATGGLGEIRYLLRPPGWVLFSRFHPSSRRWERYTPTAREITAARVRQVRRLASWMWDHFLWGLGGFLILTHWWLLSLVLGQPARYLRELAALALALTPLLFLLGPGHKLRHFIPGGLSRRFALRIYMSSFVAIWLYCLPVAFYQVVWLCGLRSRVKGWKPTPKPSVRTFGATLVR